MLRNIVLLRKYSSLLDHLTKEQVIWKDLQNWSNERSYLWRNLKDWRGARRHQQTDKCIFSLQKTRTVNSSRYWHKILHYSFKNWHNNILGIDLYGARNGFLVYRGHLASLTMRNAGLRHSTEQWWTVRAPRNYVEPVSSGK